MYVMNLPVHQSVIKNASIKILIIRYDVQSFVWCFYSHKNNTLYVTKKTWAPFYKGMKTHSHFRGIK